MVNQIVIYDTVPVNFRRPRVQFLFSISTAIPTNVYYPTKHYLPTINQKLFPHYVCNFYWSISALLSFGVYFVSTFNG